MYENVAVSDVKVAFGYGMVHWYTQRDKQANLQA